MFLSSHMLFGYVDGSKPRPAQTTTVRQGHQVVETANLEFLKWIQKDQLIMAWIYGTHSENALRTVYGLHTSQEVLFYLAPKYNRVFATRKLALQRRIQTMTKGTRTMSVCLSEIKTMCDQLDSSGAPIPESEKFFGVLNGLGRDYESICVVIDNSMDTLPAPCLDDIMSKLIAFEDKVQDYDVTNEVVPHQAFYTDRGEYSGRGRGQHRGGNRGRNYSTQGRGSTNSLVRMLAVVLKTTLLDLRVKFTGSLVSQCKNATNASIHTSNKVGFHSLWLPSEHQKIQSMKPTTGILILQQLITSPAQLRTCRMCNHTLGLMQLLWVMVIFSLSHMLVP